MFCIKILVYLDEYDVQHPHLLRDKQLIHYPLNRINYRDNQNLDNHEYESNCKILEERLRGLSIFFRLRFKRNTHNNTSSWFMYPDLMRPSVVEHFPVLHLINLNQCLDLNIKNKKRTD